ncbi:MAG: phosphoglycerate mutase [Lasallia pustulata]|uniref:Phosphoglycerate mutase n=1 Tax=Lasallia pustulata TaxID=136370 RepID=A0A5M8PRD9_9LECA|nr:MAG: phosphoglycerate mutase [Lasallia pustulata]
MVLTTIYLTRHGFRVNWTLNPATGEYHTNVPSPTRIPSDPPLAAYGVEQATQLAARVATLDPPVGAVYSSPFYRCLETLRPVVGGYRGGAAVGDCGLG